MRTIYLLPFLFILIIACEIKQEQKLLPAWLEEIIEEKNQSDFCYYFTAYRYSWNNQYYYELENPLSSCYLCEVYDQWGNLISWSNFEEIQNYELNRTDGTIIWECGM